MDESRIGDISQVTDQKNELLTADFTENEVKEAIFQMKHNKAPDQTAFQQNSIRFFWSHKT